MSEGIDLNRGVMVQKHPTGMLVYMYINEPGIYFTAHGTEIPAKLAREAFFDVDLFGREKLKRERMRSAMTAIELELELANSATDEEVLVERDGFRVVKLALGSANVFDEKGNKLNPLPIPEQEAIVLLDHLAPEKKGKK